MLRPLSIWLRSKGRKKERECLDAEGATATTGLGCVGVGENKTLTVESAFVIKHHADEIQKALAIDDDFSAIGFKGFVALF